MKENCAECKHHDVFWGGSGCNLLNNGERCKFEPKVMTNADRNPTNCQDCAFFHGWSCQPDRGDYSDFEKCEEGRKRWLQQPAE